MIEVTSVLEDNIIEMDIVRWGSSGKKLKYLFRTFTI